MLIMRIRISKCVLFCIIVINVLLFFVSWKYFTATNKTLAQESLTFKNTAKPRDARIQEANKFLQDRLTVVFRDFFHNDNDLKNCIDHLLPFGIKILVICDSVPYPPMTIFTSYFSTNQSSSGTTSLIYKENVHFFHLDTDLEKSVSERNLLSYIVTKYTLILPDGYRLSNGRQLLQRLVKSLTYNKREILAVPFSSNNKIINFCFQINSDLPNWTLEYEVKNTTKSCDMVIA